MIGPHELARGRRATLAALALYGGLAGCASPALSSRTSERSERVPGSTPRAGAPRTRAERTNYLETSRYADVVGFLDSLKALGAPFAFGSIGKSHEGREIPYVVASRPLVRTAAAARATGKPIVYVQGNIHAGEVEGKEALQALLRDLAFVAGPSVLDSIVLIAVPIYNADGNERVGPQEQQRSAQNGPELVGQRPNAQGLDLNRDYVKAEAPETRASLAMFDAWDPDVFVDLHTTDGSFHGYALTYSPSLHPAAPLADYTRDLLSELRKRVRDREGYETFDYGNFSDASGREVSTDSAPRGWSTYDHRPRFGTNYYGLRNRVAILSEAYSHDPFERRVKSTYAFTKQLLSLVAERGVEVTEKTPAAHTVSTDMHAMDVPLRAAMPSRASDQPVIFEVLGRTGDSSRTQAGVPRGLRRSGQFRTRSMPVFDRFEATLVERMPLAYLLSAADTAVIARLHQHGVRTTSASPLSGTIDRYVVDSIVRAPRAFQGHNEVRVVGRWQRADSARFDGMTLVPMNQASARLAMLLLEPESDDGFTTWNVFDDRLRVGRPHPVLRVVEGKAGR